MHIAQSLSESFETSERPRRHVTIESSIGIEPRTETHVLAQAIDDGKLTVAVTSHDQMKTIGS